MSSARMPEAGIARLVLVALGGHPEAMCSVQVAHALDGQHAAAEEEEQADPEREGLRADPVLHDRLGERQVSEITARPSATIASASVTSLRLSIAPASRSIGRCYFLSFQ